MCENIVKNFKKLLKKKAKEKLRTIIFPESYNKKILQAVSICMTENLINCVLLGNKKRIFLLSKVWKIPLKKNIKIINPKKIYLKYLNRLMFLRSKKGMNIELAKELLLNNSIILSIMILESGKVDGMVAGIEHMTSDVIRPTLQLIQATVKKSFVSSMFFMLLPKKILLYADCALNISPNYVQLSKIALQTADTASQVLIKPRIAMLSYNTGILIKNEMTQKIIQAINLVKKTKKNIIIDGPLQYDAAISTTVSKLKSPNSPLKGKSNILIFPDLNSGNITYKAVQRSSGIISIGPILQGLLKPVNDLSRGASVTDIVYTAVLTAIQVSSE
ncbi:phosphate acetyltransferase [Buchnera aphidicola]|uniref:phosphate acetyltransferase n=1 Tax=Buchnera aphidicola TaxID=9 RepID=UPI00313CC01A